MSTIDTATRPAPAAGPGPTPRAQPTLKDNVQAELFKLRTTSAWWLFTVAIVLSTVTVLIVNAFNAHALLLPFSGYVKLHRHHDDGHISADFLAHLKDDWTVGHNAVTQAATIYTSGQLIGLLLVCLLGIVIVTSEFFQQTATNTFLITPRRGTVMAAKMLAAILLAVAAWLVTTVITVTGGALFLRSQGYGTGLGTWAVDRAILLNLAAFVIWAVFGVGFGAMIRSQLVATVSATVLYLIGAAAASAVFDLINTYVITGAWVLKLQVIAPAIASQVMISPTPIFTGSPPQWVGAVVLIAYSAAFAAIGLRLLRTRDIG